MINRIDLLGVGVDPLTIPALIDVIAEAIARRERWIIAHHNLHSVVLFQRDPKMRALYAQARIVYIDSMPLIYWARLLGYSVRRDQRITFVDWWGPIIATAATEGWRVFYLGGKPGVAAKAAGRLRQQYPSLVIDTHHGYLQSADHDWVLNTIASFQPHILMVGMGMPRQEHWTIDHRDRIEANATIMVGAAFDYIAGTIPTPPRWMGRIGLE